MTEFGVVRALIRGFRRGGFEGSTAEDIYGDCLEVEGTEPGVAGEYDLMPWTALGRMVAGVSDIATVLLDFGAP